MLQNQYVGIKLEDGIYGIDIMTIKEITEFRSITKIPNSPSFIEGIINIRGIVVPVINLKKRLHLHETEIKENSKILIIGSDEKQVGFIVDDASQVMTLKQTEVDSPPELICNDGENLIVGIAKVSDKIILLLDLIAISSEEQVNVLDQLRNHTSLNIHNKTKKVG